VAHLKRSDDVAESCTIVLQQASVLELRTREEPGLFCHMPQSSMLHHLVRQQHPHLT